MPRTSADSRDERRAAAQRALRERAGRIARLRRRVFATALGTFALAFAVIAFDGSMGSTTKSSAAAAPATDPPAATTAAQPAQDGFSADDGFSAADDGSSQSSSSSSAPLTTSQS